MKISFSNFLIALIPFLSLSACAQYPSVEWQISTAVLASPEEFRAQSTVLGYRENGILEVLRKGTNNMICLADNPETDGFSASSYPPDLEPFMERGRTLKTEGLDFKTIFDIRESEAKSGTLKMPKRATLYVLSGDINAQTKEIENTYLRYVIYIPFATPESTGLPTKPSSPSEPWLMDPGTHRAHIMISPKQKKQI